MNEKHLTQADLDAFRRELVCEERSGETVAKYMRDVFAFYVFLGKEQKIDKEAVIAYKAHLAEKYKASSANSMLVALNRLLAFLGWHELQVKLFRLQRKNFRESEKELTKQEYQRLLAAAHTKKTSDCTC